MMPDILVSEPGFLLQVSFPNSSEWQSSVPIQILHNDVNFQLHHGKDVQSEMRLSVHLFCAEPSVNFSHFLQSLSGFRSPQGPSAPVCVDLG